MKDKRKRKKKISALILLLLISIGFAILSTTLNINGVAGINKHTWNIHWDSDSVAVTQGSVTSDVPIVSGTNDNTVTFETTLELPGDFYEFTVDAINEGDIDGIITLSLPEIFESDGITPTTLPEYIHYTVTYDDRTTPQQGDILKKGESQTYKIRVEFDSEATEVPATDTTYKFKYTVTYEQTKSSSQEEDYEESTTAIKCEDGNMVDDTNWCHKNPGVPLLQQNFQYYTSDTTYVESGWATFNDLYGSSQKYYFENGYAKKGWHEENNKKYYLSTFDDDDNGYINCNMLKDEKRTIDGVCYEFASDGVATESTGCTDNDFTYKYYSYNGGQAQQSNTFETTWRLWTEENNITGTKRACANLNENLVCFKNDGWDYVENQEGYITKMKNKLANLGITCVFFGKNTMRCVSEKNGTPHNYCQIDANGVGCGGFDGIGACTAFANGTTSCS